MPKVLEVLKVLKVLRVLASCVALVALVPMPAPAQRVTIEVSDEHVVALAGVDGPVVEPHLSVNPKDPNNFLAGAMVARADGTYGVMGFASRDAGRNWESYNFGGREGGDVWTAFLGDGVAVLSMLTGDDAELLVHRSTDGGRTWSQKPATVARGQDHPTLLVAPDGALYTVSAGGARDDRGKGRSAVVVTRSTDGGLTFADPARVIISNLSYEPHNPAVLPDGTLLIPVADHRRPGSRRVLRAPRDWLLVSTDRGQTFSEPMLISESCDGRGGWSSLAVFRERIYHVCAGRELEGIQFRHSDNAGETWSEPTRIDHPGDVTPQTRTPAMAVNGDGVVALAWYDARNDRSTIKGNFRCQEIFFTASLDGGVTFLPEVKVSTKPSCPAIPRNVQTALRFPAGGEYMGMAALPDGSFRLLWSDSRTDLYRLYTASVSIRPVGSGR